MTELIIDVEGLKELINKFDRLPPNIQKAMINDMYATLNVLWENVPAYAPQAVPPEVYTRTGTLGRTLGVSQAGGKAGKPTVYSVTSQGNNIVGTFGTNLSYAQHVIDPDRQAYMHKPGYKGRSGWWTMDDILERATAKINKLWDEAMQAIIKHLGL